MEWRWETFNDELNIIIDTVWERESIICIQEQDYNNIRSYDPVELQNVRNVTLLVKNKHEQSR